MKKIAINIILSGLLLAGCSLEKGSNTAGILFNGKELANLSSAFDPVCKMDLHKHIADTTSFEGKLYGFCSKNCKESFLKDPHSKIRMNKEL